MNSGNRSAMARGQTSNAAFEPLEQRCLFSAPAIPLQIHKLPKGTNFPGNLTVDAKGDVWFTCGLASEVGYITPAGKTKIISTASASSHGIDTLTIGPDGNIWFAEFWDNVIGEITAKGQVTSYKLDHTYGPQSMTLGPDGHLWLTTFDNYIGRVDSVANGQASVSWFGHSGEGLHKIVSWNGSLYFQETDTIGEISTAGVFSTTEFKLPSGGTLADLTVGPDGNLWFTENNKNSGAGVNFVGHLTPQGAIVEDAVSSKFGTLSDITPGAKGKIFFREGSYLEEMTPAGKILASKYLGFIAGGGSMVTTAQKHIWCAEGVLDKLVFARV